LDAVVIFAILLKGHKPEIINRANKTTVILSSVEPKDSKKRRKKKKTGKIYLGVENASESDSDSDSDSFEV